MNRPKRLKWIVIVVAALALAAGGYFAWHAWGPSQRSTSPAAALGGRTVKVERGDVITSLTVYGTVVPKQQYTYTFSPDKVSDILVKEGNRVDKDQVLVKLDNKQEELSLLQAQDALNTAKAEGTPATIKERQLAYDIAQANFDATTLRAPFAGVVAQVNQATGSSDQDTIVLIDTGELNIDADVDQLDVPGVAVGQDAVATIDALSGKTWPVTITSVGGIAVRSGNSAAVTVTASIPTPDPSILVGFTAELEITTSSATNVLRVPISSLVEMPRGWMAMKMVDGKATPQLVQIGTTSDQYAEVKSGLQEGDEILLYPEESGTTTQRQSTTNSDRSGNFRTNGGFAPPAGIPGMP
jgi:membrane fusion protein, macrolide-specific efflux system